MKTIFGTKLNKDVRGVLYLCDYDCETKRIKPFRELIFEDGFDALTCYAEIPNPASQLAKGETFGKFCLELMQLHRNMANDKWNENLAECL
jgi:hypothetical protein